VRTKRLGIYALPKKKKERITKHVKWYAVQSYCAYSRVNNDVLPSAGYCLYLPEVQFNR